MILTDKIAIGKFHNVQYLRQVRTNYSTVQYSTEQGMDMKYSIALRDISKNRFGLDSTGKFFLILTLVLQRQRQRQRQPYSSAVHFCH